MAFILYSNIDKEQINHFEAMDLISNVYENIKFIFPTSRLVRYFSNKYIREYFKKHKRPISLIPIYTFDELVLNKYKYHFPDEKRQLATDFVKNALMEIAIENADLKYYKLTDNQLQFMIGNFLSIIDGFQNENILPIDLEADINTSNNKAKYLDLIQVYSEYLKIFKKEYFSEIDASIKLSELDHILTDSNIHYFQYFNEFRFSDIEFLKAFKQSGSKIIINFDYSEEFESHLTLIKETISNLINIGFQVLDQPEQNSRTSFIQANIFNDETNIENKLENINLIEAGNITDEVKKIATEIKLLKNKGIPFKDIYIFTRSLEKYSYYFRDIFQRSGVPINISERFKLIESKTVRAILDFLRVPTFGYKTKDVLSFIKNNLIDFKIETESLNLFEEYISEKRIIELIQKDQKIYHFDKKTQNYFIVSNKIFEVFKDFENLNKSFNLKNLSIIIQKYIYHLNIHRNILTKADSNSNYDNFINLRRNEKNSRALSEFLNLLFESIIIWEKYFSDKINNLQQFYSRLESLLANARYQIRELFDNGVTLTSIEQSRGIPKKINFLCGMVEGEFPINYETNKFIGKDLKHSEIKHIESEKYLFYQFLSNGITHFQERSIYISYPQSKGSETTTPSSLLNNAKRLFNFKSVEYPCKYDIFKPISKKNHVTFKNKQNGVILDINNSKTRKSLEANAKKFKAPSSYESYIEDPYLYFLKEIISTKEYYQRNTALSPFEIGNVLHSVFAKFYLALGQKYSDTLITSLEGKNYYLPELENELFDNYFLLLKELLFETIEEYKYESDFPNAELTSLVLNSESNYLKMFLDCELKLKQTLPEFKPFLFEYSFEKSIDGIGLKGRIDRIDYSPTFNKYIIYDYKYSSNIPTDTDIKKLKKIQLLCYALVTKKILKDSFDVNADCFAIAYVNLKEIQNGFINVYDFKLMNEEIFVNNLVNNGLKISKKSNILSEKLEELLMLLKEINKNIANGNFLYGEKDNEHNKILKRFAKNYEDFL